jgi:hypothetical protein
VALVLCQLLCVCHKTPAGHHPPPTPPQWAGTRYIDQKTALPIAQVCDPPLNISSISIETSRAPEKRDGPPELVFRRAVAF